jgi:hypothetical protein
MAMSRSSTELREVRVPRGAARVSARLTPDEQRALRKARLKKAQLKDHSPKQLARLTGLPLWRCEQLVVLLRFEELDSVGPATAEDLWVLGYRSLAELRSERPREMYERLCGISGVRLDPCVEDVFRAIVAQARDPQLPAEQRNWWYWTQYRESPKGG